MVLRSTVIGAACTVALVALLALSRQFDYVAEETLVVTQVETIELAPPPPPPEITPPDQQSDDAPPPAPALELPSDLPSIDAPAITLALDKVPLAMTMQVFHTDTAPAKVPAKPVIKAKPKPVSKAKIKPPVAKKTAPKEKSHYSAGELDTKPRQRYTGKYKWPRGAKGRSASVKLCIEIDTSGHVKVISVVSSTNPALNPAAIKVASGSRFTPPLFKGRPVKARFYKTYTLKK